MTDLITQAHHFVDDFAAGGPDFLRSHLPSSFIVATPAGANVVSRERFVEAAIARADLVTGQGLPQPTLMTTECIALGDAYCLATATWALAVPGRADLTLIEDFLIDLTGEQWRCLAYLLRQDLPTMLS